MNFERDVQMRVMEKLATLEKLAKDKDKRPAREQAHDAGSRARSAASVSRSMGSAPDDIMSDAMGAAGGIGLSGAGLRPNINQTITKQLTEDARKSPFRQKAHLKFTGQPENLMEAVQNKYKTDIDALGIDLYDKNDEGVPESLQQGLLDLRFPEGVNLEEQYQLSPEQDAYDQMMGQFPELRGPASSSYNELLDQLTVDIPGGNPDGDVLNINVPPSIRDELLKSGPGPALPEGY